MKTELNTCLSMIYSSSDSDSDLSPKMSDLFLQMKGTFDFGCLNHVVKLLRLIKMLYLPGYIRTKSVFLNILKSKFAH